ncbi:FAD-dependent oxidoreductase [Coraliomargarita parva]|uniref:FAD-dependent oxidoreductase n=1 Tax=Coraliomargarita parva TaxID=3014050 RepID=UPI0022B581B3|nr:FAD-dependent oxidoreductase [Coraliomargarita parva]
MISEPSRQTPLVRQADVVVCGAGPAGVSAAIAAAASGAETVLIESAGCLGGVWTSGLLTYVLDGKGQSPVTRRILDELNKREGQHARWHENDRVANLDWAKDSFIYEPESMKWVLERLCLEFGIHVRLHTRVCDVVKRSDNEREIEAVITESKSGREAWQGKVYIDTTGDGDVAAQAGCNFDLGRPGTGEVQPLTLMCLVQTPFPERLQPMSRLSGKELREAFAESGVVTSYASPVFFEVRPDLYALMLNHKHGSALNAGELSQATFEARDEVMRTIESLREAGGAWEGLRVVATANQIGVREGRRIRGRYTVTVDDMIEGRSHPDAVCRVHFPIDVHSTRKEGQSSDFDEENQIRTQPYDVPLRSLIAADVDNLMMAGRNISGDFIAHSSYRVTGNSVAMGEAAGAFAADAVRVGERVTNWPTEHVVSCVLRLSQCFER